MTSGNKPKINLSRKLGLERLIADIRAGKIRPCTQFFDVVWLYDARNQIVHGGSLGLTEAEESQATWFIAAWLLRPVLRWFAEHPDADLSGLDNEITALPAAPGPSGSTPA